MDGAQDATVQDGRKRKHGDTAGNSVAQAYQGVSFVARRPAGETDTSASESGGGGNNNNNNNNNHDPRPDSPRFFFQESYRVSFASMPEASPQVVHQHVNGLTVVAIDHNKDHNTGNHVEIASFKFTVQEAPACSAAEKRKKQAKMLKRGPTTTSIQDNHQEGIVTPTTQIAEMVVKTGDNVPQTIPLYACVWGTVVELNSQIVQNPNLLLQDPLLDGHLAIIQPSGPFPPPPPPPPQLSLLPMRPTLVLPPKVVRVNRTSTNSVVTEANARNL